MATSNNRFFRVRGLLLGALGLFVSAVAAPAQEMPSDRDEIVHVLNRITFGPKPGDVEMVQKMGLHNYLEQQLHPETIDDSAVDKELAQFDLVQMSAQDLATMYVQEVLARRVKANTEGKLGGADAAATKPATPMEMKSAANATDIEPPAVTPETTMQPSSNMESTTPGAGAAPAPMPVKSNFPPLPTRELGKAMNYADKYRSVAAIGQMERSKLLRAVDSQRQLQEVLVDFWGNHFNIDMKKNLDRILKVTDDREVIRPNIWGKFRDLLEASAKSPAMLNYLDNATSTAPHVVSATEQQYVAAIRDRMMKNGNGAFAPQDVPVGQKRGGINENYAREIMELHTLGVDGGYTQQDVQEVARCFTGWSFDRQTSQFSFKARAHDDGAKVVLGHQIPAGGGIKDGEMVLDILATQPATAHHIALEMCERFVSDTPEPALVNRIAGVFTQSGGDLRQVTEAILTSPEFLSPKNFNNKIKSPLEFAVSAVRASDASMAGKLPAPFDKILPLLEGGAVLGKEQAADRLAGATRQSLNWHVYELGEPLFACTPPTGYTEVSKSWVSPGALIERLNFAMALTEQKVADIHFDPSAILAGIDLDKPEAVLDQCVAVLLHNNVSDATRNVLQKSALPESGTSQTINPSKLIALIIGSPEFQRK